mgnify:FL=1
MCKFCYPLVIVPLGVDVQVEICKDTYLEHSDKNYLVATDRVEITHCPFCGQELN